MNGSIVLDGAPRLPEGSRVEVAFLEDDDLDAEPASIPIPPETETHEEFLESLRQFYSEVQAGIRGISAEEARRLIGEERGWPDVPHFIES